VYKFYRCENKNPPPRGTNCEMKSVSQTLIEDAVWKEVTSIAESSEKLVKLLKEDNEKSDKSTESKKPKLENLQRLIREKDEEEERLLTAYRKGVIALDELEKQKKNITKEKTELTREANRLEAEIKNALFEKGKTKSLKEYVKEVWSKMRDFTTEELFEFYHVVIESITLHYDKKKDKHGIDINFAIELKSQNKPGKGATFASFGSGNHKDPQRHGIDP
jgi:site-specific DNA recombinase